ncbi:PRC-barrel domain-containing protein [Streptomyces solaniscabiei]|uniref:PRC-barrel domain-containing protein n=1 Tax=Streptomyces solaniscabiei TaxID=2683255 RepID=UPI001CE292C2|nr:PRC-barrel domain-containing protein [Streptomyces solaniscabiei]
MMLFTEVRGLPVLSRDGDRKLGAVTSLTVDAPSGVVSHLRFRAGRLRGETVVAWEAVRSLGPGAVRVGAAAPPDVVPPGHDLLGRRVLTEAGVERGTVLDVAFDPRSGRILALFTTRGELSAGRMMGLGDHALVVRAD